MEKQQIKRTLNQVGLFYIYSTVQYFYFKTFILNVNYRATTQSHENMTKILEKQKFINSEF